MSFKENPNFPDGDFDDKLFTTHLLIDLRAEDEKLEGLDKAILEMYKAGYYRSWNIYGANHLKVNTCVQI